MPTDDKPKAQFFRVGSSVVKEGALREMKAVDLKVYLVLALHANWYTGKCWPSYQTIRGLTGCSKTSIAGAVRHLVQLGAIAVTQEKAHNGRRNVYLVFRTLRLSPGGWSIFADIPRRLPRRDKSGRFQSNPMDDPQSANADDPQSSRTDQNENYLNETNGKRSKSYPPRPQRGSGSEPPALPSALEPASPDNIISEETIKEYVKLRGKPWTRNYMIEHGYRVPEFLLEKKDE